MKIATWNVNSVRARLPRVLEYVSASQPDVLCLQELKCTDDLFPALELTGLGYQAACWGQKTYNGVAILAKEPITDVTRGLMDGDDDTQARLVAGTVRGVRIFSFYAPNGQSVDSPAYQFKLRYYDRLRRHLETKYRPSDPLLICGDFNVAPEPRDVYDPKVWEGQTLFTERERAALRNLAEFGLHDAFRRHHPEPERFTWWDYRMGAFHKNKGLRIDHLFVTQPLFDRCVASDIDREARKGPQPSDHAPIWADFAWDAAPSTPG